MMNTAARLTWTRDTYTGTWSAYAPEFAAHVRKIGGRWYLSTRTFGLPHHESQWVRLAEAKADAATVARIVAESLA